MMGMVFGDMNQSTMDPKAMVSFLKSLDPGIWDGSMNTSFLADAPADVEHMTFTTPFGEVSMTITSERYTLSPSDLKVEEVEI